MRTCVFPPQSLLAKGGRSGSQLVEKQTRAKANWGVQHCTLNNSACSPTVELRVGSCSWLTGCLGCLCVEIFWLLSCVACCWAPVLAWECALNGIKGSVMRRLVCNIKGWRKRFCFMCDERYFGILWFHYICGYFHHFIIFLIASRAHHTAQMQHEAFCVLKNSNSKHT